MQLLALSSDHSVTSHRYGPKHRAYLNVTSMASESQIEGPSWVIEISYCQFEFAGAGAGTFQEQSAVSIRAPLRTDRSENWDSLKR